MTLVGTKGCNTPGSGGVPNPAISYTGPQIGQIGPGRTKAIRINDQWNGRIFNQNGRCGGKGEKCTMLEYNLGKSTSELFHFIPPLVLSFHSPRTRLIDSFAPPSP